MMDDREREASDPLTPGPRLIELATGDPSTPWSQAARRNPSLPTSTLVHLLALGLTAWQNPAAELLFLQGIYPYKQASQHLPTLIRGTLGTLPAGKPYKKTVYCTDGRTSLHPLLDARLPAGLVPATETGTKALPYLAEALQGWWLNAAKIRDVVQHFANALHLAQRGPGWFASQAHIEMIEMMATCLLSNKRLRGDLGDGIVRKVLGRIQTKKYRTKGLGDGYSKFMVSGIDDLIKMARGDMKGQDVDLYWFVQRMTTGGPGFNERFPAEEAAMLRALRERWPVFPLLRFVP